jgi:GNAT superfamily N-acetyltransferase
MASHPANLFLIVMDNGVYEVTGGQPIPGAGQIDFGGLARGAGIRRVYSCETIEEWRALAAEALSGPGPVVVWLKVEARPGQRAPTTMRPMHEQIARLQEILKGECACGSIILRTELRPGDLETVVYLHGVIYAQERGFDSSFETYVAGPLSEFARAGNPRERLWIAERDRRIVGCVAVIAASVQTAQLRWFLVDPCARGAGLGKRLLDDTIAFCKDHGYCDIVLWTESALTAAAHLYEAAGFRKTEEKPGRMWGVDLVEEKYELRLG